MDRIAKLTLQLVDKVTGPARSVSSALGMMSKTINGINTVAMAPSRALQASGRSLRQQSTNVVATSAAVAAGLGKAGQAVYDFQKAGNKMQAFGLLDEDQRKNLEEYAKVLNKDFPFTNKDIIQAAQELFRAGLTYEQAMASLRGSLQLAMSGDIDVKQATDIATNIMTAMKLPMETMDQVTASMAKVNDALAYAATNSNTDVKLMGDTFRYVAPLAAAAGNGLEEVTAISMELAKAGIKGAEAGVALRSSLVRMVKPTKPMLAALEAMNIDINNFTVGAKEISSDQVVGALRGYGFEVENLSDKIAAILGDKTRFNSGGRLLAGLTDMVVAEIGDESVRDQVSDAIAQSILGGAERVDLFGLLKTLREKGASTGDIARIFDVRMGSRLAAVLDRDLGEALKKVYAEYEGVSGKMAGLMMQGIVGEVARLVASMENMANAMADSGVLKTIGETMDAVSAFVNTLSATDPDKLEAFTYAMMGLAAIGPVGLALSGAASALGLMVNPITIIGGAVGVYAYQNLDKLSAVAEKVVGILRNIGESKFAEGFLRGLADSSAILADGLDRTVTAIDNLLNKGGALKEWLNSSAGENWGERLGSITGYLAAFGAAAAGIGLIARPLRAIGKAVLWLSGIKPAWGLLKFITGLGKAGEGLARTAAGVEAVGGAVTAASAGGAASKVGRAAKLGRFLTNPVVIGGTVAAWALANQSDKAKDKDLVRDAHDASNRNYAATAMAPQAGKDFTLGSMGGFRMPDRAPDIGKLLPEGLGFKRADAATSRLPSGKSPITTGMSFDPGQFQGGDEIKNFSTNVTVSVSAPISITTTDANVGKAVQAGLDGAIKRSAETAFGGVKSYGDN